MKSRPVLITFLLSALCLVLAPAALASTTWYVNGVKGSDRSSCTSAATAYKTIGHAISRASSGDTIFVAAATYKENLAIGKNLNLLGSGAIRQSLTVEASKRSLLSPNRAPMSPSRSSQSAMASSLKPVPARV